MQSSRRTFLKHAAGLSAAYAVGFDGAREVEAAASPGNGKKSDASGAGWYDRPMRWAQLSFVEDDPGNYDLAFWLDYFKKVHADAALLDAGGCVAFYPTEIPLHYRSKWLGNRDSFGEITAACRKLGMNVVARTDSHACHRDAYDAHPDWIAVDENGNKRRHWADKDFWVTCALGPYNFEFMTAVHREIMAKYMPDSIFTNRWAGSGMCYCEPCQKNFRDFSGLDLPRSRDPKDPARRKYMQWHQQRLFDLCRLWDSAIKEINPKASYLANAGGGALSELNMKTFAQLAPMAIADRQSRRGLMAPWAAGMSAKEYRATMGMKPLAGLTCVGIDDSNRWKDSVTNADEIRMWMVDGIAHNYRPTFTKFNAKPYDMRWFAPVEEVFEWHYANEKYLRNEKSLARVGLVYSQQTGAYYGFPDTRAKVEDATLGFYQALVEARIPFDMLHDQLLDSDHVSQYRTLILPNIACLSDAQCEQLKQFVRNGGGIVATLETSLYDENGTRRNDFGLAQLFGASFAGKVEGPMLNSYLNLQKDTAGKIHPLLAGLGDTKRIINGTHQVHITAAGSSIATPLLIEPSFPDLPMEEVFPRADAVHDPGVYLREEGSGRVVYFPADIDRTFWDVLAGDHAMLLRNAVLWVSNESAPLEVQGKGVLDVSLWSQRDSITAHLVNLTNPMMLKGPIREIIPISSQKVRIRLPRDGRRVIKAHLLVAGAEVPFREENGAIAVEVPTIHLHEVVALDFAV
jgi:putative glycosyl hydrolase-like family 6 (GHL6) protein/glycosyl hydrolase family 42 (putative beta-galactosidase)